MHIITKNNWMWAVDKPEDIDFKKYIGRHVKLQDDKGRDIVVEIEEILGSLRRPTKFQINSKGNSYFVSMLSFYAQMNGESVSDDDIAAFDEMTFHVKENPMVKRGGLWQPNKKNLN